MIIVPEPVGENPASCLVGQVELGVGPLLQECADEALCLAVGLGSVGASGAVSDLEGGAGLLEYGGVRVAESPLGEDGLDLDTCVGEVDAGSGEGAGRCSAPLVHGHVQVFVAGAPTFGGRAAPEHLVTPAVRDAGQLLGVEVQLPAGREDLLHPLPGQGPRRTVRTGAAILEPGLPLFPVAVQPLVDG